MSEMIVLGLIPGTQIQITFLLWIVVIAAVCFYAAVRYERRKKLLRTWVIVTSLMVVTRRPARV